MVNIDSYNPRKQKFYEDPNKIDKFKWFLGAQSLRTSDLYQWFLLKQWDLKVWRIFFHLFLFMLCFLICFPDPILYFFLRFYSVCLQLLILCAISTSMKGTYFANVKNATINEFAMQIQQWLKQTSLILKIILPSL